MKAVPEPEDEFFEDVDWSPENLSITIPSSPVLLQMYLQKTFHDIVLVIDGKEFSAHKAVLTGVSSFFETMLTSGFKEAQKTKAIARIALSQIKASTLKRLLDLIYTGTAVVTEPRALLLLKAAHMYQMDCVLSSIANALGKQVCLANYLELWGYSNFYDVKELQTCVLTFVQAKELEVSSNADFVDAPSSLLSRAFISITDRHRCRDILVILQRIEQWVLHDATHGRKEAVDSILHGSLKRMTCRYSSYSVRSCQLLEIGQVLLRLSERSPIARRLVSKILSRCAKSLQSGRLECDGLQMCD